MKKSKRILAFLLALGMMLVQFPAGLEVHAADSAQPNVWFEKTDGTRVELDGNTLNLTSNDKGRIVITAPADCTVEDWSNFEWDKNQDWNNAKEFVDYSQDWEMGTRNGGYYATLKKAGSFKVPYKYQIGSAWQYRTIEVNVVEEASNITELKAVIKRSNVADEEVLNGGSYDFIIADGAEAYVELYGKVEENWQKLNQSDFNLSVASGAIQVVASTSSFYINPNSYPAEGVLTLTLNSEPDIKMDIHVKGIIAADRETLLATLKEAKAMLEDEKAVYDEAALAALSEEVNKAEPIWENRRSSQDDIDAADADLAKAIKTAKTTPVVYLDLGDSALRMENDTFVVNPLTVGTFKIANAPKGAYTDWDCVEEISYTNENGKTERGYNFWISEDGTYQPHGAKKMNAKVTIYADKNRKEVAFTKSFAIDTQASNVTEIRVVDKDKTPFTEITLQGREWMTVSAQGMVNGEWVDLPAQAFVIEPQHNIHTQANRFCLWTPNHPFDIVVKMVDNDDVNVHFTATSERVDVESFKVTVPKTTWEMDKWDFMTNSYVGVRYYADPTVDMGFHVDIQPSNASYRDLNWKSNNPDVAVYSDLHSAGVIPKKAGKVSFEITSNDNPSLPAQTLELEFVYKTPLKKATTEKSFELAENDVKEFTVNTVPANATERRFDWSSSNKDLATVKQDLTVDENGNTIMSYKLVTGKTNKDQTVTIKGVPFDTTAGCKPIEFKVKVTSDAKDEWLKNDEGWSWYRHADGSYTSDDWEYIDGNWYHFSAYGWMQTGWLYTDGQWYYLNEDGTMATGWLLLGNTWYYLTSSGAMSTGWTYVYGTWYYMSPSGAMQTGWVAIDGYWYYMSPSGAMQTGWLSLNGTWYYLNASGWMQTGWKWINGSCYYFYSNGAMAANTWIGGSYVNGSGAWVA